MMKWLTALFFSIIVHILIFLSYVLFATESVEKTTRKITNVNFLDDELQVKEEVRERIKSQEKSVKKEDSEDLKATKNKEIENLLILDQNTNHCNIELRAKGIIIYFRSLLETYGLAIPYYKLVVFKVTEKEYTFNIDSKFLKIKVKSENDHSFIRKIMEEKAKNTENYIS